jgi:hypothetical protein
VAALPSLSPEAQRQVTDELRQAYGSPAKDDWRSLNSSRGELYRAVAALGTWFSVATPHHLVTRDAFAAHT